MQGSISWRVRKGCWKTPLPPKEIPTSCGEAHTHLYKTQKVPSQLAALRALWMSTYTKKSKMFTYHITMDWIPSSQEDKTLSQSDFDDIKDPTLKKLVWRLHIFRKCFDWF